ncbi:MAG TPA: DNA-directed RNA polymerase subunit omega [Firmicutes bacterium]|nr:DNA-directed RNA polymerase subunit omega [Bacillota bacterium]HHY97129.1 DNA-directed RNA polymerase subunit omega [Bacillota bacterium]
MQGPTLDELIDRVGSRYALVVAAAKRARQLMSSPTRPFDEVMDKPVVRAINEIYDGKVRIEKPKPSIK